STLSWAPTSGNLGDHAVVVTVSDGQTTAEQSFILSVVAPPNQAPQINSTPSVSVTATQSYTYAVVASDGDNDALRYSLTTAPAGMAIIASTGQINRTPTKNQVGDFAVTVLVSDGQDSASQSFSISVAAAPNQAPVITSSEIT